jgi:hypothetical protein
MLYYSTVNKLLKESLIQLMQSKKSLMILDL